MIFYPQRMQEHRHKQLLMDIAAIISARAYPTHLVKVKSHIGIIGNEIADSIATGVAKGRITPQMQIDDPSNKRTNEYWVHFTQQKNSNNGQSTKHRPNPLPDLNNCIKDHCHQYHRLGTANTQTIYFSAVTNMNSKLNTTASRKFMAMQTVTDRERTNVIKLLNGNLYTNKLAKRFGHTATDKCPLCKQPDGGYHLAGGCPKLTESYLARHHAAGAYILEAIRAGAKGGTIIQADIGSRKKQQKAGLTPLPTHIPTEHLPTLRAPNTDKHGSKTEPTRRLATNEAITSIPDITLYEKKRRGKLIRRRYTIIEIKYCTDTRPHIQHQRADQQHTRLISTLVRSRPNTEARLVTILLGMAGYIYLEETEEQLQTLGINGQALNNLITNLHVQAVKSLTSIVQARRQQEKKQWRKKLRLSQRRPTTYCQHQQQPTTTQRDQHTTKITTIKRKHRPTQRRPLHRLPQPNKKHKTGIG